VTEWIHFWSEDKITPSELVQISRTIIQVAKQHLVDVDVHMSDSPTHIRLQLGKFTLNLRTTNQVSQLDPPPSIDGEFLLEQNDNPIFAEELTTEPFLLLLARELSLRHRITVSFGSESHGIEELQFQKGLLVKAVVYLQGHEPDEIAIIHFQLPEVQDWTPLNVTSTRLTSVETLLAFIDNHQLQREKLQLLKNLATRKSLENLELDYYWHLWEAI